MEKGYQRIQCQPWPGSRHREIHVLKRPNCQAHLEIYQGSQPAETRERTDLCSRSGPGQSGRKWGTGVGWFQDDGLPQCSHLVVKWKALSLNYQNQLSKFLKFNVSFINDIELHISMILFWNILFVLENKFLTILLFFQKVQCQWIDEHYKSFK